MASSSRNAFPRQETSHSHLTPLSNNYNQPLSKPSKNNAATAQMTVPNPSLMSPNGLYANDASLHQMEPERQMSSSALALEYGMNGGHDNHDVEENPRKRATNESQDYPRRRATIACEVCRGRKSRCDGAKPRCKLCAELKVECIYREPGIKLDAGHKLILEHLDRLDGFLQSSLGALMRESGLRVDPFLAPNGSIMSRDSIELKNGSHTVDGYGLAQSGGCESRPDPMAPPKPQTTPTLHLLEWPKIRELVSRSYDPNILMQVEMKRKPLQVGDSLSLDLSNNEASIQAFFEDANIWYACVNPSTWTATYQTALSYGFRESPESCLVLLVLALGNTSSAMDASQTSRDEEPLGMQYFSAAWGLLPSLMTSHDILASQCIVLASAYLFYLMRPFEAWTLLSSTSMKLQFLLTPYGDNAPQFKELTNRVLWNAILFERDLLTEFDLPRSGLLAYEPSVETPSAFPPSSVQDDDSPIAPDEPWYLLASISLHKLQARIDEAIYSKNSPTTTASLEPIVTDLETRLSFWHDSLPFSHRFSPPQPSSIHNANHHAAAETSLRLRYHSTRAAIFRPFLLAVLDSPSPSPASALPPIIRSACSKCLESCMNQLEHIGGLAHDHYPHHHHPPGGVSSRRACSPNLWQEALLAVNQTLLVMGASMVSGLAELLPPKGELDEVIRRVVGVVEGLGAMAPSLAIAGGILREAEGRRREGWWRDGGVGVGVGVGVGGVGANGGF